MRVYWAGYVHRPSLDQPQDQAWTSKPENGGGITSQKYRRQNRGRR